MRWSSLFSPFLLIFQAIVWLLQFCWLTLSRIAAALFGSVSWQRPAWFAPAADAISDAWFWCRSRPRQMALAVGLFAAVFIGGWQLWDWYQHRPKPVTIGYQVDAPYLTYFADEQWHIDDVLINFDDSVAPLEQIDKTVSQGLTLSPKVDGEWRWVTDRQLRFVPKADWPIDQEYEIQFAKTGLLAANVLLSEYETHFHTKPFRAELQNSEFYQDPVDPQLKKMVATFSFSHPVDTTSFEKRLELKLADGLKFLNSNQPELTVTYDKEKLHAYVHTAALSIPREDLALRLLLAKGVAAERGGNATEDPLETRVMVPGRGSLRFNNFDMAIVDNERFEPIQLLNFASSAPVAENALTGKIKAWLLPEFPDNYNGNRNSPYRWSQSEVTEAILKKSQTLPLSYQTGELEHNEQHGMTFSAPVGRMVYVLVPEGVQAFGGYEAIKPTAHLFQVERYPTVLKLMSEGSLLTAAGAKKIAYVSRGLGAVRYEIGRLLPNQLHHMIAEHHNDYARPYIEDYRFDRLVERFADVQPVPGNDPTKAHIQSIDLDKYLYTKEGRKRGIFVLRIRQAEKGEDPNRETYEGGGDGRLIVVTDLGVVAKRVMNGNYELFVMSIATGRPVEGARVDLVGTNGQPVVSDTTDSSGHASIAMQERWRREKTPLMFVVTKEDDTSFLPLNRYDRQLDFSRFDIGGIENASSGQQLSAYAFTDRNLYRPGETAHLMYVVRTADWQGDLTGMPVEIDVIDPRGLLVQRSRMALSRAGFEGLDFVSRDSSLTGEYQFNISLIRDQNRRDRIGGANFTLREFEPDRLKVHATLAPQSVDGWLKPEQVQAAVQVMHLFGNPAGGARVDAELTLSGGISSFSKYPDYEFRDPAKPLQAPVTETLTSATTDDKGEASFDLNLKRFDKASYRLHLLTRAFEPGSGRSVNAQASVLVSSASYLVGVKADGALNYISRGSERNSHWLAIDQSLQATAASELVLEWVERRYVSVLAKQDNGTYRYVSRLKETIRDSKPSKLGKEGLKLALATDQPGDFSYVLRNGAGETVARLDYSVSGAANLSRSLERNAELQLSLNKTEYEPGETIELNIRAPYTGAGLITIERDKVLAHQWFQASTSSSVQRITVPKDLEGTAYLNVQFVRDMASDEVYTSPLSYGVVPFTVNLAARRQTANLTVPKRVKPGETITFQLATGEPARAAVIAVDEGILQVAKFQTPDPLGFFFQKRRLQVQTSQILDLILPEFERLMQAAAAGGDAEELLRQQLNPFKKKRQPPVAWWSGVRDVAAGDNSFDYTVPDSFNGKLRVYTVIATASKVAVYEDGTEVQGDLILNPNVPMAAAPGDELVVTLGVYNNLKGKGQQAIKVRAVTDKGLSVLGEANVTLNIGEGQEQVAEYRVKLTETLGSAAIRFEAESGDARAKITDSISVRPATPYRTVLRTGSFDDDKASVAVTRDLFSEFRDVNAGLAPSPLIWAQGLRAYLAGYPYSCTEQITSQAIPALILKRYPELGEISGGGDIDSALRTLRSRQNDAGGFGMWAANPVVDEYASLHVSQFLIEAKDRGEEVPDDMLRNAMSFVQHLSGKTSSGLYGARQRAYGIYLLARQGINPAAQISALKSDLNERYKDQWPHDLTAAYLAASYRLLKQDELAWRLMKEVPWQTTSEWKAGDTVYYDPLVHDAVHLHLLARHFPERLNTVPDNLGDALGKQLTDQRFHSLSAGLLLLALDQYHVASTAQIGVLSMAEIDKAGKSKVLPLKSGSLARVLIAPEAKSLQLNRSGKGRAFYVLAETGFDRVSPEPISKGLEVQRDFVDANDKILTSVKVGDEFFVRLRLRGTAYDESPQIAFVDLLPGGLEPVPVVRASQAQQTYGCADESCDEAADQDNGYEGDYEGDGDSDYSDSVWESPLGVTADRGWRLQYADVRDDRVVLYGNLSGRDVITMKYRVRAVNPGTFQVPAPYAEGMYDRAMYAIGKVSKLEIVKP
ncbi:alpha-2-macroglobulin [Permianibacter sp. IMCC34836]|uniref:alpha-2-macroglobulin n=1 Tax=Permianibacter fluminis TaxID=2738515 RepID=UPI0015529D8A|nr:alpha-2-macroglobulin [Permianibacter fluminis]NQD36034.1 alpha-2-macroglobulin [Permianibacter fluminis]